ncbi:hypothetical protein JOC94_003604 [Bacillus thermophilus]|uniref:DUF5011 domain-containing protein n=1 Tax=Siminovitchia thermophila TaxID=1245522 RepID=A0ABS2RAA8_9BACI|nr:immunoglobulin-like domain-containing protein [Siminovitchia thermophila]MBM7716583.1 hypothetical protein [Siminovitchia thermophila]
MIKKQSMFMMMMILLMIFSTLNLHVLNASAADQKRPTIDLKRTLEAPTIDGSIDEPMWKVSEPLTKHIGEGEAPEATFGLLWDQEYLYVAMDMVDDTLVHDGSGYWYQQDNIGLFLDPTLHQSSPYVDNDLQIGLVYKPNSNEPDFYFGGAPIANHDPANESKIKRAIQTTEKGWSVEIAVPWEMLDFDPNISKKLGIEVHAVDRDNKSEDDSSVSAWSAFERSSFWNDTYGFGEAILVTDILSENFDGLEAKLQPAKDESIDPSVLGWTHETPEGWEKINASNMPQGVTEWQGWSFATRDFWISADTQLREEFSKGSGVIAIADPDEWDDQGSPASQGQYDSTLVSPKMNVNGGDTLDLSLDTHYRQEGVQTALITAKFDTGEEQQVLRYDHNENSDNKGIDVLNKTEIKKIKVPDQATSMTLEFRLFNAVNNYFWAIDNIRLLEKASLPELTLQGENPLVIELGSEFIDPGVTAFDQLDGDLTDKVVVEHEIDTSNPGIYEVTYSVTNSTGFTESVTREVMVTGTNANEGLKMSMSVISDTHTNIKKTERALWDLNLINPNQHAMVVVGDVVDSSYQNQYDEMKQVMADNPRPDNLFYTIGNHEYYGTNTEMGKKRFLDFTGLDTVYYEREVNGYPFIVLGQEEAKEPINLSDAQLQWFEDTMKKQDPNKPIFVFLHQPLPFTINGTWDVAYYRDGINQYKQLKETLSKYPNAIVFSGHQHWDLRLPDMFGNHDGFYQVSTGAVINTYGPDGQGGEKVIDGTGSTGLYVEVHDDKVVIKGRDFTKSDWIDEYQHVIPLKNVEQVDKSTLESVIAEADKVNTEKYTEASVQVFAEKLAAAKEVMANESAPQSEVDGAVTALQDAIKALQEKEAPSEEVDKSTLESVIAEADKVNTEKYTEASVQVFAEKLAAAKEVMANESATQSEVDGAVTALQDAIKALQEKEAPSEEVDKSTLESVIAEADKVNTEKYTEASVQVFAEKLAAAKEVMANESATQSEVDGAVTALQDAIKALQEKEAPSEEVDKSTLESVIAEADKVNTEKYTEASVQVFAEKLAAAKEVMANESAPQSEVDGAVTALQDAIKALQEKEAPSEEVDKSALESVIAQADKVNTEKYTEASVEVFAEKLAAAKEVMANESAPQSEVDGAVTALQDAMKALQEKEAPAEEVDKSMLESVIAEADKVNTEKYTEASVQVFAEKLAAAKEVMANESATQSEVDGAVTALQGAMKALQEKEAPSTGVDKKALESLIKGSEKMNTDKYTPESVQVFLEKLSAAKEVLHKENATQSEVDGALKALQDAMTQLVVSEEPKVDKPKVDQPTTNEKESGNKKVNKTYDKQQQEKGHKGSQLPNTATSMFHWALAGFLLVGIGGLSVYIANKRKRLKG